MSTPTSTPSSGPNPLADLQALRATPEHLAALLDGAPEEALRRRPPGGGESVLGILEHLRTSERLLSSGLTLLGGDHDEPVPVPGGEGRGGAEEGVPAEGSGAGALLEQFQRDRRVTVKRLESLSLVEWSRPVRYRDLGEVAFAWYVAYFAGHERSHLLQIEALLGRAESRAAPAPFLAHLDRPFIRERLQATERAPLRLTANENRMGLPDSVRCAIVDAFADANLYPDDSAVYLTQALAERHGVGPDGVVHAHGSTDLLRIVAAAHAVGRPRVHLITADPTFEQLQGYAKPYAPKVTRVPLVEGSWAHDLEAMRRAAEDAPEPALVYVCNPNNPTGTLTPVGDLRAWIEEAPGDHLFAVDEAYFEYVDDPAYESLDRFAWERPNVVVLRTFSKIYGMAGVRVGYAVAHPRTAERLKEFKSGRGPNHLGNMAALAALQDPSILRRAREANREARRIVYDVLAELGLGRIESHANFVMHEVGGDVEAYVERMRKAGFAVGRPFAALPSHNRVSLGTPAEMRRWADALRELRRRGWV